jgi:hypothetical protein
MSKNIFWNISKTYFDDVGDWFFMAERYGSLQFSLAIEAQILAAALEFSMSNLF